VPVASAPKFDLEIQKCDVGGVEQFNCISRLDLHCPQHTMFQLKCSFFQKNTKIPVKQM